MGLVNPVQGPGRPSLSSPDPRRLSFTERLSFAFNPFRLNFATSKRSAQARAPAARLWNPVNTTPRDFNPPNIPVTDQHPTEDHRLPASERDETSLLTLSERRRSQLRDYDPQNFDNYSPRLPEQGVGRRSIGLPREHRRTDSWASGRRSGNWAQRSTPEGQPRDSSHNYSRPFASTMAPFAARAAGMVDLHDGDKEGVRADIDIEAGGIKPHRTASRSSLPGALSRRSSTRTNSTHHASRHSMTSQRGGLPTAPEPDIAPHGAGEEEEFAWGPSHPCFPHANPHVPETSPLATQTRVIRVRRDWMIAGDEAPTFANLYPEVLDPIIPEPSFRDLVKHLNTELTEAFSPWSARAWIDALLGVATFWAWDDFGMTGVKKRLAALEQYIEDWNRDIQKKSGENLIKVIPLRRTGYMTLDIQIPDPQIGIEDSNPPPDAVEAAPADAHLIQPRSPTFPGNDSTAPQQTMTDPSRVGAAAA